MAMLFASGISHDNLFSVLQNFLQQPSPSTHHEWVDGSHASRLLDHSSAEYGAFCRDTGGLALDADVDHG